MNAKKGKKGKVEPEPEPEVPVVHEPTEEELEAERIAQQEEKKRMNRDRVLFAKPVVKHIVSHHSGTVLAEEEPRTPLDSDLKATATKVFDASATDGVVDTVLLPELLKECGFIASAELLQKHIPRFCNLAMKKIQLLKNETAKAIEEPSIVDREIAGERNNVSSMGSEGGEPEQLSKQEFLCFLEIFHASAFHFGARLRKFAARNQLREVEELLVRNCPANTGNGEGLTPLHYCCEYGRPEVIELLHSIASKSLVVDAQVRGRTLSSSFDNIKSTSIHSFILGRLS